MSEGDPNMQSEQVNELYTTLLMNNQNKRNIKKHGVGEGGGGETGPPDWLRASALNGAKKMSGLVA